MDNWDRVLIDSTDKCDSEVIDMKKAILIVLDSMGVGELPDAAKFGDTGAHTFNLSLIHI